MGVSAPKQQSEVSRKRAGLDATAGALAGAVSRLVVGPLDVVKIRMQVQLEPVRRGALSKYTGVGQALKRILVEEGVTGLWRGTVPALALTAPYCAVQFTVLQQCKRIVRRQGWDSPQLVNAASFLGGATAGAAATLASYPFDLLRTILASQGSPPLYRGMVDAGRAVVRQRGLAGLYSGVGITLTEIVPYAGIQFGTYDLLTRWSESVTEGVELSAQARFGRQFLVGLLAGFASKGLTHPLDVVKKRYQITGLERSLHYGRRIEPTMTSSLRSCVSHIWRHEGAAGFYKGLTPSLIKAAPASAVTFVAYEFFISLLLKAANTAEQA